MFDLSDEIFGELAMGSAEWLGNIPDGLSDIFLAALAISVAFVAYKLIKRALNKA